MLAIYNESKTPWMLKEITENVSRISSTFRYQDRENKECSRTIGMKFIGAMNILPDVNFENIIETEQPVSIFEDNTNINFHRRNFRPYVNLGRNGNKDILFITIDLKGSIVTDISVPVLHNYIAHGCMSLIVSVTNDAVITLHNATNNTDTKYVFNKADNKYSVIITTEAADETAEHNLYTIRKYRPSTPTYIIFTHVSDEKSLKEIEDLKLQYYKVVTFSNKAEFEEAVETVINDKYTAATLFVNLDDIKSERFSIYKNNYHTLKSKFSVFNVLLKTGKILKR